KVCCVACHGTRDANGNPDKLLPTSVPLGDLRSKYTIASLTVFLDNPHQVRPSGRMPKILNTKEAREVANYLMQGVKVDLTSAKGGSNYRYFEGTWDKIPDFNKLTPKATGVAGGFDLSVAKRGDNFGFKFEGYFKVEREGAYRFSVTS